MSFNLSSFTSTITTAAKYADAANQTVKTQNNNNVNNVKEKFEVKKDEAPTRFSSTQIIDKQLNSISQNLAKTANMLMSNMQANLYMRDMLNLPKEWNSLMNEFLMDSQNGNQLATMMKNLMAQNGTGVNTALLALLRSGARIDMNSLVAMLNKHYAMMSDKMLKYMGQANMTHNMAQLKDVMMIGASIANSSNVNPNELMRNLLQMYLPWLPITEPKEQDLNEIQEQSKQEDKDAQVLFYVSTKKLGNFKIEIMTDKENEIFIFNTVNKKNDELVKKITAKLDEEIKKQYIDAKVYFSQKADETIEYKDKQLYIVNSTTELLGVTLLHLIPKVLFELDETAILDEKRKEKLEETDKNSESD